MTTTTASTATPLRDAPKPPSYYADTDLLSYANQWKQQCLSSSSRSSSSRKSDVVFGLTFFLQEWLIGCTGQGEVCVWKLLPKKPATAIDVDGLLEANGETPQSETPSRNSPALKLKVSTGVLYACKMVKRQPSNSWWLVVSGDDGVLIFDWNADILPLIAGNKKPATTELPKPILQFQPYPSPFERCIEVNDFVIHENHLYGAAGDAFGCYKWHLETGKLVTTYHQSTVGGGGYLHAVELVPNTSLLLTGGEDGLLCVWDISQDKLVDTIDMKNQASSSSLQSTTTISSNKKRRTSSSRCWISSIKARDENWWFVAGGEQNGSGGFISTLHGPTRSVVSTVDTTETPQQLAIYRNKSSSGASLISVANESFVSHWKNALSLEQPQRVWCHQASGYAIAVSSENDLIATGGVGDTVDIFEEATQYGKQLTTREEEDAAE